MFKTITKIHKLTSFIGFKELVIKYSFNRNDLSNNSKKDIKTEQKYL